MDEIRGERTTTSFRIIREQRDIFKRICKKMGIVMSDELNRMITRFNEENKDLDKDNK